MDLICDACNGALVVRANQLGSSITIIVEPCDCITEQKCDGNCEAAHLNEKSYDDLKERYDALVKRFKELLK